MNTQQSECVSQIHQETNTRIYDRNIPSQPLQPYVNVRPVMTKYSYFPIVDPRKENHVPLIKQPTFNPHTVFNPGNAQSPWSGFASNINKESELRNQIYALQKCSQAVYVPNSTSDLYQYSFNNSTPTSYGQTHPLLFETPSLNTSGCNPLPNSVGSDIFMNSTRVQVRDLTKTT